MQTCMSRSRCDANWHALRQSGWPGLRRALARRRLLGAAHQALDAAPGDPGCAPRSVRQAITALG
jgi:hypothetical protein